MDRRVDRPSYQSSRVEAADSQSVSGAKSLRISLSGLSPKEIRELQSLARESDPAFFWEGLRRLGYRLERNDLA